MGGDKEGARRGSEQHAGCHNRAPVPYLFSAVSHGNSGVVGLLQQPFNATENIV